jgi:carbon-monoxide dehydrogenase medium subunit
MYDFQYHRPASIDEAKKILADNDEAIILAGGMTMLPTMKMRLARPTDLVDLSAIDSLRGIKKDGKAIEIGAMTPHADTIGGSLSNGDPAADYAAAVLGLNAPITRLPFLV